MSSTTSRLALYKPASDGSENVNVVTDLNNNWDKVDALLGAVPVTSSTRPAAPYAGMIIRETNTGKVYVHNGGSPASGGWVQIMVSGVGLDGNLNITGGASATTEITVTRAAAADHAFRSQQSGDSSHRFVAEAGGKLQWGSGSGARDTNLFRQSADVLRTDDSLSIGVGLDVSGNTTLGGTLAVAGAATFGQGKLLSQNYTQSASADTNLTASDVQVPAGSKTVTTLRANAVYKVQITCDFLSISANNGWTALGKLYVDGVLVDGQAIYRPAAAFTGARATVGQTFNGTLAATGSHTFSLRVARSGGADSQASAVNTHTRMTIEIFE